MTIRLALIAALVVLAARFAHAHDVWADGSPVPPWVKAACCGPEDVHHLKPSSVEGPMPGKEALGLRPGTWLSGANDALYYVIEGYPWPILASSALPSQDGDYWIFYKDNRPSGDQVSGVYCLFVPMVGERTVPSFVVTALESLSGL